MILSLVRFVWQSNLMQLCVTGLRFFWLLKTFKRCTIHIVFYIIFIIMCIDRVKYFCETHFTLPLIDFGIVNAKGNIATQWCRYFPFRWLDIRIVSVLSYGNCFMKNIHSWQKFHVFAEWTTTTTTTALFENWKLGDSHCHWYGLKMEITSIQIDEITIAEWLWELLLTLIRSRRLFVSLECIVIEFHFIAIHFHLINFEWSSEISN